MDLDDTGGGVPRAATLVAYTVRSRGALTPIKPGPRVRRRAQSRT